MQYPAMALLTEQTYEDMIPTSPPALGIPSPITTEYPIDYFVDYFPAAKLAVYEGYNYRVRPQEIMFRDQSTMFSFGVFPGAGE